MTGNEDYLNVVRRAIEDPDFRERLIESPAETWEAVTGVPVPDDLELVVLEDGPRTAHIVLPDPSLSAKELDARAVSGGHSAAPARAAGRLNPDLGRFCCASLTAEMVEEFGL